MLMPVFLLLLPLLIRLRRLGVKKKHLQRIWVKKESDWCEYDSTYLVAKATKAPPIYIDQGLADDFLSKSVAA